MTRRRLVPSVLAFVAGVIVASGAAFATTPFTDVAGNSHAADIDAIYNAGITSGCTATTYCPADPVKRDQMATFLARAAGISSGAAKHLPVANARGETQAYCAIQLANRYSLPGGPCQRANVDAVDDANASPALALGTDGMPIIAYQDLSDRDVWVAHCDNLNCSGGVERNAVDAAAEDLGADLSIAIGRDGFPVIAYKDETNDDLKIAHCGNRTCSNNIDRTVVDSAGFVGDGNAIGIGSDGLPIVSYADNSNRDLRVVHCTSGDCTTFAAPTPLDVAGDVGFNTSLAIGDDGKAVISYLDSTNDAIKVTHCANVACTSSDASASLDGGHIGVNHQGAYNALAIGTDGFPFIAYFDAASFDVQVAHCTTQTCAGPITTTTFATDEHDGYGIDVAIGTNGKPALVYLDNADSELRFARCDDLACTTTTVRSLDLADFGGPNSLVIAPDGMPVVAYVPSNNLIRVTRQAL